MSKRLKFPKFLFIFLLLCFPVHSSEKEEGLPLFWWKEGDFINFGDHLSYVLVEKIVGGPLRFYNKKKPNQDQKLLATGSIYYFANEGDVVWGSGVNGKRPNKCDYVFNNLDVRCVRGPLTRDFLREKFGIIAPEIYGDPALLFPYLFPEFKKKKNPQNDYVIIIHYLDVPHFDDITNDRVILATESWDKIVRAILDSKFVISSSLHGVVLAEAYGIPARLLRLSDDEPLLKFYDYYLGSGRSGFEFATSVEEALSMGGEPPLNCDVEAIYNAFPFDYWPHRDFPKINFQKKP